MSASRRSRRSFIQFLGLNGLAAAGASRAPASAQRMVAAGRGTGALLRLDSNENSSGPGPRVLGAIEDAFSEINRYAFGAARELTSAIAASLDVQSDQVELGCGSTEILEASVTAFTASDRGLVTPVPTFELPANLAHRLGRPVVEVPVTAALELDLEQMAARAAGAGLVYVCNPNNPTPTLHGLSAIEQFVNDALERTPNATILIDEAYHEYVERPDYRSAVPLALANPRVVVSRTFSKIFGLAGMRIGYAVGQATTLNQLRPQLDGFRMSRLSTAAALAALSDQARVSEQRRANHEARAFIVKTFKDAGCEVAASEANFVMVDVRRDIRVFQGACRQRGVSIARPFPPLMTHARVTIGTMEEMQRAAAVFQEVLAQPPSAAHLDLLRPGLSRDVRDRVC